MINNMDEFSKLHDKAIIVNYDFGDIMEYGLVYRTSKHFTDERSMEKFAKVNNKYITYPYIQQFQKGEDSNLEMFIIHGHKTYRIERIDKFNPTSNYKIVEEMMEITSDFYNDSIFMDMYMKARDPRRINEPLLKIEE